MYKSRIVSICILLSILLFSFSCDDSGIGATPPGSGDDAERPQITGFTLPDGNTTSTATIAVSITDDGTADAWMITTTATAPASDAAGWLSVKPALYTLPAEGSYSLYAWARNDAGLVSSGKGPVSIEYSEVTGPRSPQAGEIIITEIMADPAAVNDGVGEWFEVYNTSSETLDITGCVFSDENPTSFTVSGDLLIAAGDFIVFANSDDSGNNFTPDYIYSGFQLSNSEDEIIMTSPDSTVIDTVIYTSSTPGRSLQLDPVYFDSVSNDNLNNWSDSTTNYNGDLGTPGAANEDRVLPIFFSEYVEGSGNNKALEIYNGTADTINMSDCTINIYQSGAAAPTLTIALSAANLAAGEVFVIGHPSAASGITSVCDQTDTDIIFNGDDAVELVISGVAVDIIGQIGVDPGSSWGSGGTVTENCTLRRKMTVTCGDKDGSDVFDPSIEWDGLSVDTFDGLGSR